MIHFREAEDLILRHYDNFEPRYFFDGKFDITMADWPVIEIGSVDRIEATQIATPPEECYLFNYAHFEGGIRMFSIQFEPKAIKIERLVDDMDDEKFLLKRAMS